MNMRISQKAIILNQADKLLAVFRTETAPAHPNTWDLPGGELEVGEDPISSIIREVKEETGLEVQDIEVFDIEGHEDEGDEYWVTVGYKGKSIGNEVILSFEHNDFRWVSPEEFLQLESQPKLHRFVRNLSKKYENICISTAVGTRFERGNR